MTWFRVDDGFAFHTKAIAAGNPALGLWVRAGSWCGHQLTDGFVPDAVVPSLGTHVQARALVAAGLWTRDDASAGYRFHQWTEQQPTREKVEQDRAEARERMRRNRSQRRQDGGSPERSGEQVPNVGGGSGSVRRPRPVPSRPDLREGGETVPDAPTDPPAPPPLAPPQTDPDTGALRYRCRRHAGLHPSDPGPPCRDCAAVRARAEQPEPSPITPPCGECDERRQVVLDDGRVARCPRCHPLRPSAAS